ncbi:hypothetical protein JSY36_05415 [Bacillus sp. H-16]|uniref:hypothetical protein n=1 Tax=Alteribacter salitolerans TaxID=2912333 RepID=UPI0019631EA2|nr:hypothetical protein [Alteribacter salitolerans]MBM7095190.1 hypothetical protein [Alteribacter salitolerans]
MVDKYRKLVDKLEKMVDMCMVGGQSVWGLLFLCGGGWLGKVVDMCVVGGQSVWGGDFL